VLIALIAVAVAFLVLTFVRVGGARRAELLRHWPSVLLAVSAALALSRGAYPIGVALAVAAVLAWRWPISRRLGATQQSIDLAEARRVLGVGEAATAAEIRAAFRSKMHSAHPDRGGSHAEAARLVAARDRLLKR
jgi:hypothetical protein